MSGPATTPPENNYVERTAHARDFSLQNNIPSELHGAVEAAFDANIPLESMTKADQIALLNAVNADLQTRLRAEQEETVESAQTESAAQDNGDTIEGDDIADIVDDLTYERDFAAEETARKIAQIAGGIYGPINKEEIAMIAEYEGIPADALQNKLAEYADAGINGIEVTAAPSNEPEQNLTAQGPAQTIGYTSQPAPGLGMS